MTLVLVADDDELTRELVIHKLQKKGLEVISAEDGLDAYEKIQLKKPDIAILDVMMPGLDGLSILRKIKEQKELRHISVILLSARRQEQDIVSGLELGAVDYVTKPFIPEELLTRVSMALNGKK